MMLPGLGFLLPAVSKHSINRPELILWNAGGFFAIFFRVFQDLVRFFQDPG